MSTEIKGMNEVWGHSGDKVEGGKSEGGVSSVEWARKWSSYLPGTWRRSLDSLS